MTVVKKMRRHRNISPPASLEAQCHREFKCGVYFVPASTRDQNKRHGFSKEYMEGEEESKPLLFLLKLLQEGLRGFWLGYSRTQHWLSLLLSSLSLRVSSLVLQAGGESFHHARITPVVLEILY
jgi:hypothetical protein